jgi:hypothetical protein
MKASKGIASSIYQTLREESAKAVDDSTTRICNPPIRWFSSAVSVADIGVSLILTSGVRSLPAVLHFSRACASLASRRITGALT